MHARSLYLVACARIGGHLQKVIAVEAPVCVPCPIKRQAGVLSCHKAARPHSPIAVTPAYSCMLQRHVMALTKKPKKPWWPSWAVMCALLGLCWHHRQATLSQCRTCNIGRDISLHGLIPLVVATTTNKSTCTRLLFLQICCALILADASDVDQSLTCLFNRSQAQAPSLPDNKSNSWCHACHSIYSLETSVIQAFPVSALPHRRCTCWGQIHLRTDRLQCEEGAERLLRRRFLAVHLRALNPCLRTLMHVGRAI